MESHNSSSKKENAPPSQASDASQSNSTSHSNGVSQANEAGQHEDTTTIKPHEPTEDSNSAAESSTAGAEPDVRPLTPSLRRQARSQPSPPGLSFDQLARIMDYNRSVAEYQGQESTPSSNPQGYLENARAQARRELNRYPESPPRMVTYLSHLIQEPAYRGPRKSFGEATRETHNWAHLTRSSSSPSSPSSHMSDKKAGKRKVMSQAGRAPPTPRKHINRRRQRLSSHGNPRNYRATAFQTPRPDTPLRLDEHRRPLSPPPYSPPTHSDPHAHLRYDGSDPPPHRPVVNIPHPSDSGSKRSQSSRGDEDAVDMDDGIWLGREDTLSGGLSKFAAARRALQRSLEAEAESVDEMVREGGKVDEVD